MSRTVFFTFSMLLLLLLPTSCTSGDVPPGSSTPVPDIANPASVYCIQQGGESRILTATDGSQAGLCVFPNGNSCDEWAYYRGECSPEGSLASPLPVSQPTGLPAATATIIPTPQPVDPVWYQDWWTYVDPDYGFSLLIPPDWVVDQSTSADPLMDGHLLVLHAQANPENGLNLRVTFRRSAEDFLLWPTGVGQGEFVPLGDFTAAGGKVSRTLLVCPDGNVSEAWYRDAESGSSALTRGDLQFGFILSYKSAYCQAGLSLGTKDLMMGEMIIASLTQP